MYGNAIPVDIGYCQSDWEAGFAFLPPRTVHAGRSRPLGPRAVQNCPAVNGLERQLIEVLSPIQVRLRLLVQGGQLSMSVDPKGTFAKPDALAKFLWLEPQARWRDKAKPILRLRLPFFFVTDEPCMALMLPPFFDAGMRRWPGTPVAGRWPVTVWPASVDWALEWEDPRSELVIRQGDPLAYVMFEFDDLNKRPNLVEAELTDALAEYRQGIDGVHHITDEIDALWQAAAGRRPQRLMVPANETVE
ncbi:MAG: hypothetical protein AAF677_11400 [Pseudomonadota bacterium]